MTYEMVWFTFDHINAFSDDFCFCNFSLKTSLLDKKTSKLLLRLIQRGDNFDSKKFKGQKEIWLVIFGSL